MAYAKPYCKPSTSRADPSTCNQQESDIPAEFKKLFENLINVISANESTEPLINQINATRAELLEKGTVDQESLKLLLAQYKNIKKGTINEEKILRNLLDIIYEINKRQYENIMSHRLIKRTSKVIKFLNEEAMKIPVWIPPSGDRQLVQLCGATEPDLSYTAKRGDLVAGLMHSNGKDSWILAAVVEFKNGKYLLEDVDVEDPKREFVAEKENVKPLPVMRADPDTCPGALFVRNQFVLALYPQTTIFFKAIVKAPPKNSSDGYQLLFEDDRNKFTVQTNIPQRFVLSHPLTFVDTFNETN